MPLPHLHRHRDTPPPGPPKLGRRPADPARYAATLTIPLTGRAPAHPLVADHLSQVPAWCPGANDRFGTCGPCSVANSAILTWKYLLGEDITVTDEQIYDLYRRSGNPGFDPATGEGDDGVDMTVMLAELVRNGLTISHLSGVTETVKPLAFGKHGTGIETVHAVTAIFGLSLFGLDLDVAQQAQTDTHLWDYAARSPSWGGHAVAAGAYTSSAARHTADESVITWAEKVGTTDLFLSRQLAEAYVIIWPALWDNPAFTTGVDRAKLAAAYKRVTGRPFPLPTPPSPVTVAPGGAGAITMGSAIRTPIITTGTTTSNPAATPHTDPADRSLAAGIPNGWIAGHSSLHSDLGQIARQLSAWLQDKRLNSGPPAR